MTALLASAIAWHRRRLSLCRRRDRRPQSDRGLRATSSARSSSDLDKAIAFYRDGIGLDVQGAPANADANPALRNMFGLPDAQLRWTVGRPPAMRTGVEIVEIRNAGGKPLERRIQDLGAFTLIVRRARRRRGLARAEGRSARRS